MHVLYVDMSGNVGGDDRHFIMAGVAVYETAIHPVMLSVERQLQEVLGLSSEDISEIELHASEIRGGRNRWRKFTKDTRKRVFESILRLIDEQARQDRLRLFCAVLEKEALNERILSENGDRHESADIVECAYEQLCTRFDMFLKRRYRTRKEKQRGLIIVDKSRYEQMLQTLAHEYRVGGTRWGRLRNLVEVPVFVDSRASRLLQLADMVAYALWRRYEYEEPALMRYIINAFDAEGGRVHGLYHFHRPDVSCDCLGCYSRHS